MFVVKYQQYQLENEFIDDLDLNKYEGNMNSDMSINNIYIDLDPDDVSIVSAAADYGRPLRKIKISEIYAL